MSKLQINIFILLLFTNIAYCDTNKKTNKLDEQLNKLSSFIGISNVEGALSMLKELQEYTSTEVSSYTEQAGFVKLSSKIDYSYGSIYSIKMPKLIELWLESDIFDGVDNTNKNKISKAIEEYYLQVLGEPFRKHVFSLDFNNNKGNMFMLILDITIHPTKKDVLQWQKYISINEFEPAPPFVILTETDCGPFSCDRADIIKYLPATLTNAHIDSIMKLNMNMIAYFAREILDRKLLLAKNNVDGE